MCIIYGLYYIEIYFLCICFWRVFILNRCWILSQSFSASIEIVTWFLFFSLLGGVSHWFVDIILSLYPWDKFHLILVLLFSCQVMSDSLWLHELQHARLPSSSLSPGVCSNSCPLSQWWYPTVLPCHPFLLFALNLWWFFYCVVEFELLMFCGGCFASLFITDSGLQFSLFLVSLSPFDTRVIIS